MTTARSIPADIAYRLITRVPSSAVGRARTARLAPILETGFVALGAPLYGTVVPVAHGAAAGLQMVAERRSVVWISGRVEGAVQAALGAYLAPGGTFIDAGASVGFFTLLAARLVGPTGTVIAFEPQPSAAAAVRTNAALNGFDVVSVVEAALSSRVGRRHLEGLGKATARLVESGPVEVDCTSLDAFLERRPEVAPDLVKIDVEGHERDVLEGMQATLAAHRPTVVVECHHDVAALLGEFESQNYALSVAGSTIAPREASPPAHLLAVPEERISKGQQ